MGKLTTDRRPDPPAVTAAAAKTRSHFLEGDYHSKATLPLEQDIPAAPTLSPAARKLSRQQFLQGDMNPKEEGSQ